MGRGGWEQENEGGQKEVGIKDGKKRERWIWLDNTEKKRITSYKILI